MLLPHQRVQASLSTGAGGLGLSSAKAWRMSASVGRMVTTVMEVLADLSGIRRENIRRGLPDSDPRISSAAFEGASGTSATCTGFLSAPW